MKSKPAKTAILIALSALSMLPVMASAALVTDGGFEDGSVASGPGYQTYYATTAMGGWNVTAGNVDLINGYWTSAQGHQSVDLTGTDARGTISQNISTVAGQTYYLTFEMSGNPDGAPETKKLDVSLGGVSLPIFSYTIGANSDQNMNWETMSGFFTATTTGLELLQFSDVSVSNPIGNNGVALDEVSLVAVPEASTVIAGILLLLPFGASTLRILRKKRDI